MTRARSWPAAWTLAGIAGVLSSCRPTPARVSLVDGVAVGRDEVAAEVAHLRAELAHLPGALSPGLARKLERAALDRRVSEALLLERAVALGAPPTDTEVDELLAQRRAGG